MCLCEVCMYTTTRGVVLGESAVAKFKTKIDSLPQNLHFFPDKQVLNSNKLIIAGDII